MCINRIFSFILGGNIIGEGILENNLAFSFIVEQLYILGSSNSIPRYMPKINSYKNVYRNIVHKSRKQRRKTKLETTQI